MDKDYRILGIETYGDRCEICGHSSIEVHHIAYNKHQEWEDKIRKCIDPGIQAALIEKAKDEGYLSYDKKARQLDKDNRSANLSVVCGNCHTFIHKCDIDTKLLKALRTRK